MANYTQIDATANIKASAGKLIGIMVTAASCGDHKHTDYESVYANSRHQLQLWPQWPLC
jgi:hypothetical protein